MSKKYTAKAIRFIELSNISNPDAAQRAEYQKLRDELSARGLNPQSPKELIERTMIYDNASDVKKYCEIHERISHADKSTQTNQARLDELECKLKAAGIQNLDRHYLTRCLASFKVEHKRVDKRKRASRHNVSPAREFADQRQAQIAAEIADEEAQAAAAELAAEQEARTKRNQLAHESINAFMAEELKAQLA